jgi:hypothetical protein
VLHALVTFAQEVAHHSETSKTPFYLAGGVLAGWGFLIGVIGTVRHGDFPDQGSSKLMMGISAVLVLVTLAAAIATN